MFLMMLLSIVFYMQVMPFMKHAVFTIDKHYYGFITDKVPVLAITTPNKNYYDSMGIPYRTVDEIEQRKRDAKQRRERNIPHPWDDEYEALKPNPI